MITFEFEKTTFHQDVETGMVQIITPDPERDPIDPAYWQRVDLPFEALKAFQAHIIRTYLIVR